MNWKSTAVLLVLVAFLFIAVKFNRTMDKKAAVEKPIDDADPQRIMGDVPPQGETTGI